MGGITKKTYICVISLLLTAIIVNGEGAKIAVLSPTANQVFYLSDSLYFDHAPLDDNSNVFLMLCVIYN